MSNGDHQPSAFANPGPYNQMSQAMAPGGLSAAQVQAAPINNFGSQPMGMGHEMAYQQQGMIGRSPTIGMQPMGGFSQSQYMGQPHGMFQPEMRRFGGFYGAPVMGPPVMGPPVIGPPVMGPPILGPPRVPYAAPLPYAYNNPYSQFETYPSYDPYSGYDPMYSSMMPMY